MATIQSLVSQEVGREHDGDSAEVNHKTGVLMLRDDEVQIHGSQQQILEIFEGLELELLLTISTSGGESTVSVWSDVLEQPAFSPCRALKSFTQIFQGVSSQPKAKADERDSISDLDVKRMCTFNVKKEVKKAKTPECLHVLINKHYMEHPNKIALSPTTRYDVS